MSSPQPAANAGSSPPPESSPTLGVYAEMLLLSLIFGVSPVASKFAADGFPVFTVAALRVLIATAAFIPILFFVRPRWPRPSGRECAWFLLLGATGFLIFSGLYFLGLQLSSASHAVVVFGAGPMITALFAALILKEALSLEKVAGIVITLAGVVVIVASSGTGLSSGSVLGDLALLGAITSWGFYSIYAKPLIATFGPIVVTAYSVMAGTLLLTPIALLTGMDLATLTMAPGDAWLGILFSGLVSTVIAYILWNRGVRSIGPTLTMVFSNLAPVWGFITAYVLRGEVITAWHLLAGACVIAGVFLANRSGLLAGLRHRGST